MKFKRKVCNPPNIFYFKTNFHLIAKATQIKAVKDVRKTY